jgi:hypothetical protein
MAGVDEIAHSLPPITSRERSFEQHALVYMQPRYENFYPEQLYVVAELQRLANNFKVSVKLPACAGSMLA